jgi:hypothetical protein
VIITKSFSSILNQHHHVQNKLDTVIVNCHCV